MVESKAPAPGWQFLTADWDERMRDRGGIPGAGWLCFDAFAESPCQPLVEGTPKKSGFRGSTSLLAL
jgi:hypothetical protein